MNIKQIERLGTKLDNAIANYHRLHLSLRRQRKWNNEATKLADKMNDKPKRKRFDPIQSRKALGQPIGLSIKASRKGAKH